jgi:uncharacterized membrane protein
MAGEGLKPAASFLLFLNFCMYFIVAALGGWAINVAIDRGFTIGELKLVFKLIILIHCLFNEEVYLFFLEIKVNKSIY